METTLRTDITDRFYYNNDEDTREVLSELLYNLSADEEQRVSKYW